MYLLKDLIEIDKHFQSSVNIQLDLQNDNKLESYLPTRSSLAILTKYIDNMSRSGRSRATILIGPYGKGKSHLLLVLLRILSEEDPHKLTGLLEKIKQIDAAVAEKLEAFIDEKKRYLPVLISASGMNLSEAFLLGLSEALKRDGLSEIIPDSYYKEAILVLENWKQNFPETYRIFSDKIENHGLTIGQLYKLLQRMDKETLRLFRELYPEVTAGSSFAPMINTNLMKVYENVNRVLCSEHGYAGMFLVFDEFSKYVEGHETESFAGDMKIVQDICELAMHSEEEQLHIVFVAHKSIREYGNELSGSIKNTFTGVEGRLKEVPFLTSGKNNFELVKNALKKKNPNYRRVIQEDQSWQELLDSSYQIPCYQGLFKREDYEETIKYGCFPLLPMTVCLLLKISEQVAQNERSIFTFLAGQETGSLVHIVETEMSYTRGITADLVYDYFSGLFRENTGMTRIHMEWLKAEYAITKAENEAEVRAIKVLALLKMAGTPEEIPVNRETLRLSAGFGKGQIREIMDGLEKRGILIWRVKTATYSFKNNVGVDLEKEIRREMGKIAAINLCELLQDVSDLEYILPKQHNQEFCITRYFHYEYMTAMQFLKLPKADYLFEEKAADGKIVAIVDKEIPQLEIRGKLSALNDERIVVLLPQKALRQEHHLQRLAAVRRLQHDKDFLEENKVLEQELQLYEEDLIFEINAALEKTYLPENHNCIVLHGDLVSDNWQHAMEFNRFLSNICKHYYEYAPKINNEMINRRNLTVQTKRARNFIIEDILTGADVRKYLDGTSAEATIFRATFLHTGILKEDRDMDSGSRHVLDRISKFIESCAGAKHSFRELYQLLMGKGCGLRKGVLPVLLARQLSLLEDTPVILLEDKEVEISAEVMNNLDQQPENYYLYIEQATAEKERYIRILSEIFAVDWAGKAGMQKNTRLAGLTLAMQRWYRGLPQIARNFEECPAQLSEEAFLELKKFRNLFRGLEINPREVLFEKLPTIYGETETYLTYAEKIEKTKEFLDHFLHARKKENILLVKQVFGARPEDGLFSVLKTWYEEQSNAAKSCLASSPVTAFMGYLERLHTHDEMEIIEKLAKCVLDIYLEDWPDGAALEFEKELREIKRTAEGIREDAGEQENQNVISFVDSHGMKIEKYYKKDEDDSTSYFLKNALEEALEEFGESLEVNQKVAVLVKMLEKLTK